MKNVVIADLGTGNLRSVAKAIASVADDHQVIISEDAATIATTDYFVLPGQGALGTWMSQLQQQPELAAAVNQRLANGPVLGICLGLQALFTRSEENQGTLGLDLIPGQVKRFDFTGHPQQAELKVPHMGWNRVTQRQSHELWQGIDDGARFYFVHSYYVQPENMDCVMAESNYGGAFCAAAVRENIFAVQFHPEKSQQQGLKLLRNFINWTL